MDIKPQNFVFMRSRIKVIDLGCAERIPHGEEFVLSLSSKGTEVRLILILLILLKLSSGLHGS